MKSHARRRRSMIITILVGTLCLLALVGTYGYTALKSHSHAHAASRSAVGGGAGGYFADPCGNAPAAIDDKGNFHCNPPAQPSYHVAEFWSGSHNVDVTVLDNSFFLGGTYTDHYSPNQVSDYDSNNIVQLITVF